MIIEGNELVALLSASQRTPQQESRHPWEAGSNYFIRTVTHHYTGTLIAVYDKELVLKDAAWIADDGRFHQAVTTGAFNEVEPFAPGEFVIIGRGAVLDAQKISFALPASQK
jgi:hypothetical protein